MGINILDEAVIFEDKKIYAAFPSIIKLNNNKCLISFRTAPKINKHYSHLHSLSKSMLAYVNLNNLKTRNIIKRKKFLNLLKKMMPPNKMHSFLE
ncbi:hypothetical protein [uncultured Brachyspira sp.]|uniref:hypothetical protein n=1 Tax=uncultured Brachyspira sp. TaxID=221953 RepID=UPI0026180A08|nr:hypothetical protein [uncultured Brachyspira sp.]